jgi:hydrogenase/urease accessory protein HupE
MYLKDPKTGEKSVTLTAFALGFGVATLKLLFSGIEIGSLTLSPFSGGDFAAVVGAVGAIYAVRKHTDARGE